MRWTPGGSSDDVEDRRGEGGGGLLGGRSIGLVGFLVLGGLSLLFHQNLFALLDTSGGGTATQAPAESSPEEDREKQFVTFVFNDVQGVWEQTLRGYRHAKLVLYRGTTRSACGTAQAAVGPFYCPVDEKVYLDLGFFEELRARYAAPGEFAQAYVIAHEVGHHVQKLLGIADKVQSAREQRPGQANALSVRLELQADCLAGVWGHSTEQRKLLERGDIESALGAAAAVGDDRLQRRSTGGVRPETFTHGSAQQRTQWFGRGFESGDLKACDTFAQ